MHLTTASIVHFLLNIIGKKLKQMCLYLNSEWWFLCFRRH